MRRPDKAARQLDRVEVDGQRADDAASAVLLNQNGDAVAAAFAQLGKIEIEVHRLAVSMTDSLDHVLIQ